MPKGVEHSGDYSLYVSRAEAVSSSVMPKGVEHDNANYATAAATVRGVEFSDAERR